MSRGSCTRDWSQHSPAVSPRFPCILLEKTSQSQESISLWCLRGPDPRVHGRGTDGQTPVTARSNHAYSCRDLHYMAGLCLLSGLPLYDNRAVSADSNCALSDHLLVGMDFFGRRGWFVIFGSSGHQPHTSPVTPHCPQFALVNDADIDRNMTCGWVPTSRLGRDTSRLMWFSRGR